MSAPPRQPTLEGERLRRSLEDGRRDADRQARGTWPIGSIWLFPVDVDPGAGWHRAEGQSLLRKQYPRLAAAYPDTGDDASFEVLAVPVPIAGTFWWVWGGED